MREPSGFLFLLLLNLLIMKCYTRNGNIVQLVLLRTLEDGHLLGFAQDRPVIARINSAVDCNEVESYDVLSAYQHYL